MMNLKLTILNCYFFISLILGILLNTLLNYLVPFSGTYLYCFFGTIPLFVLQFVSIGSFSRKIKNAKPALFKQACIRPNGTKGNSINVASLFNEKIPFSEMNEQLLINDWNYTKRVVVYSMFSFFTLLILFFI